MKAFKLIGAAVALAVATFAALPASAQADFPNKPVRIVIPFPPGGSTDVVARQLASGLEKVWKQPVIVDNRPGGNQLIAASHVSTSPPDGYTILIAAHSLAYEHIVNKDAKLNPNQDLTPVAMLLGNGMVFAVPTAVPANTFAEFIALAKKEPGKLNEGTVASGLLELADLWKTMDVNILTVSYKGGGQVLTALVANEVQIFGGSPLNFIPLAKEGKVKMLAYTDTQRHPLLPDLPTLKESVGFNNTYRVFFGAFAPPNMPPALVTKINASLNEVLRSKEFEERATGLGQQTFPGGPDALRTAIDGVIKRLESLKSAGYQLTQ